MIGSFAACCALAATGHATAAPPTSVMNSRRLMLSFLQADECILPHKRSSRIAEPIDRLVSVASRANRPTEDVVAKQT